MKGNKNYIYGLEKILNIYKLKKSAPYDFRRYVADTNKKQFKNLLKKCGIYTASTGIFITFIYILKKFLSGLSLTKIVAAGAAIGALSTSTYVTVNHIIETYNKQASSAGNMMEKKDRSADGNILQDKKIPDKKAIQENNFIGIMPLESNTIDRETLISVNKNIIAELDKTNGGKYSLIKDKKIKGFTYAVFNSAEQIGDSIYLNVKVFNVGTTTIVYTKSIELGTYNEVSRESVSIINELMQKLEAR